MSMKKLAVLSALHNYGGLNKTDMNPTPGSPPAPVHGVNVMLGGAMISGIILVVFIFCYCCHKTHRKSQTHLPPYWRDPGGLSMEIYTVEAQSCFSSEEFSESHRPPTPGPPPAYDLVVPIRKGSDWDKGEDEGGLPSYETAVKLQAPGTGYV
ncbi:uncharacterized protein s-cup [Tribolium castaneum]